jgi:hypothetical protein
MRVEADDQVRENRKRLIGIGDDDDVKRAKLRHHIIVQQQADAA